MAVCMRLSRSLRICSSYSSVMYATDKQQPKSCVIDNSVLVPRFDMARKLKEMTKFQQNVELRKLEIDPVKIKSLYEFLIDLETTKLQLEKRKEEISLHLKDLFKMKDDPEAKQEIEKLKMEGKNVREDIRNLMKAFWEVEDKINSIGLTLPNKLHDDTPEEDKTVYEYLERPHVKQINSHVDIAHNLNLIEYKDPSCVYLKNNAASFEMGCSFYFGEGLKSQGYVAFSNPDFVRSIVVGGCGKDHKDPNSVFTIKDQEKIENYRLHLVGGASLFAFVGFHTKQTNLSSLPLKCYTIGRQYGPPAKDETDINSLFNTWQRTVVELFIQTAEDDDEMMSAFRQALETVTNLYQRIGHHFRVVYVNASSLESWESLRASFQMYSCHEQKYIEIGKISIADQYLGRRLLMRYKMTEKEKKGRTVKIISGTVIDVPKLLGCILEQNDKDENKFVIPLCMRPYCFGIA